MTADFLKWFMLRCAKTNLETSEEEEKQRYTQRPPYQERVLKWIDKFYLPNKKDNA